MLNFGYPVDIRVSAFNVCRLTVKLMTNENKAGARCQKQNDLPQIQGSILELRNVISLRYSFYGGWRNVKILSSGECRKIRDCCIFRVNDLEVFL